MDEDSQQLTIDEALDAAAETKADLGDTTRRKGDAGFTGTDTDL